MRLGHTPVEEHVFVPSLDGDADETDLRDRCWPPRPGIRQVLRTQDLGQPSRQDPASGQKVDLGLWHNPMDWSILQTPQQPAD
jgi:hypothetical protein